MPDNIDLCTRDDVRIALELQADATERDDAIDETITDASQRIIDYTQRELAPEATATRTFPVEVDQGGAGRGLVVDLNPYDLQTATTVTLHPGTAAAIVLTTSDYQLEPVPSKWGTYYQLRLSALIPVMSDFAFKFGYAQLQIIGTWGFPEIPAAAKRACIDTVTSWLDRSVTAYGAQDNEGGRLILPDAAGGLDIPATAKRKLEPFTRTAI